MDEYILLMHQDAPNAEAASAPEQWAEYFTRLRSSGKFDGDSSLALAGAADEA